MKRTDPLSCPLCDRRFDNVDKVQEHVDEEHDPFRIEEQIMEEIKERAMGREVSG